MRIALLGAECTGKTQLSHALVQGLTSANGAAIVVPELLRAWCTQHGRTPHSREQEAIAQAQAQSMPMDGAHAFVIADTTALMTAIYSDLLFQDTSLYPWALAHQRAFDLTLVMGLDLPWVADGVQRDGPEARARVDARLRQVLDANAVTYAVVYGTGPSRTKCALQAIAHHSRLPSARTTSPASNWQWSCEKCSDAGCEHQLFSALLKVDSVRR